MNRHSAVIGAVLMVAGLLLGPACTRKLPPTLAKKSASSQELVDDLSSPKRNTVMTALHYLAERRNPIAREAAHKLLVSSDDYIWFNACMYLASINDERAIPYLIKGLKHPAWRSHDKVASYLEQLTDQKHGKDQEKWIAWWKKTHPSVAFNFDYRKIREQTRSLQESHDYLINQATDPLRINHGGSLIRLVGVKLADDRDKGEALALLKEATLMQWVSLEFDTGPDVDDQGARRALVYWTQPGDQKLSRVARRGLPPVPFKGKTLVQSYLLKSGLYELDLSSVKAPEIKSLLEDAAKDAGPAGN